MDVFDLVKRTKAHSKKMKMICVVEKQLTPHDYILGKMGGSMGNCCVAVAHLFGVEVEGKQYIAKGRLLCVLGITSVMKNSDGSKRVLLIDATPEIFPGSDTCIIAWQNYGTKTFPAKTMYKDPTEEADVLSRNYKEIYALGLPVAKSIEDYAKVMGKIPFPVDYVEAGYKVNFGASTPRSTGIVSDYQSSQKTAPEPVYEPQRGTDRQVSVYDDMAYTRPSYNNNSYDNSYDSESAHKRGKKQELACRNDIVVKPETLKALSADVKVASSKVENMLETLKNEFVDGDITDAITYCYNNMKTHWSRAKKPGDCTGRALFKSAIERAFPEYKDRKGSSGYVIDTLIENHKLVDIWYKREAPVSLQNDKLVAQVIGEYQIVYIQVIDYLLAMRGTLVTAFRYGADLGIDMYSVMVKTPYYLTFVDNRIDVSDMDILAMLYKTKMTEQLQKLRNAAYLHNFMLDSNNKIVGENTLTRKDALLSNIRAGYRLNKFCYETLMDSGVILRETKINDLRTFVNTNVNVLDFALDNNPANWEVYSSNNSTGYFLNIAGIKPVDMLADYLSTGLGIEQQYSNQLYVMDMSYALKEKYIIDTLYKLQEHGDQTKFSDEELDRCIRGFERSKSLEFGIDEFKLEDRQAGAVGIIYNPVMCLTGPAGSGKTTTAEALVYALQTLLGVAEEEIMFCAPTGMAANRLKEVVKKPTRTIHSLFGIGGETYTLLREKNVRKKAEIKVLIVDESSMINLELMYNMMTKIAMGTRMIFLGDREQLPPIGPGKPFANLLTFLPCVVLNVTKRAAENSGITRNAKSLIYESDAGTPPSLEVAEDFKLIETEKSAIQEKVKNIALYHMGKRGPQIRNSMVVSTLGVDVSPDDIQIITPVNKHNWGVKELNAILQPAFNEDTGPIYRFERNRSKQEIPYNDRYVAFRKGDRVVHTMNKSSAPRLLFENGKFSKASDETGIMNGEIGKIRGIVEYRDDLFVTPEGQIDETLRETFGGDASTIYIAVEYKATDEHGVAADYIILYVATKINSTPNTPPNTIDVLSTDLSNLDLAYALTVHKLQGSQAKLVIFVIYKVGMAGFISRNMLYTAITRAKQGVYMVGNVTGYSAVSEGRKYEQVSNRLTITDELYA